MNNPIKTGNKRCKMSAKLLFNSNATATIHKHENPRRIIKLLCETILGMNNNYCILRILLIDMHSLKMFSWLGLYEKKDVSLGISLMPLLL